MLLIATVSFLYIPLLEKGSSMCQGSETKEHNACEVQFRTEESKLKLKKEAGPNQAEQVSPQ